MYVCYFVLSGPPPLVQLSSYFRQKSNQGRPEPDIPASHYLRTGWWMRSAWQWCCWGWGRRAAASEPPPPWQQERGRPTAPPGPAAASAGGRRETGAVTERREEGARGEVEKFLWVCAVSACVITWVIKLYKIQTNCASVSTSDIWWVFVLW